MKYLIVLISLAIFGLLVYLYFGRFVSTSSYGVDYDQVNESLEKTQETVDKYNETTNMFNTEIEKVLK